MRINVYPFRDGTEQEFSQDNIANLLKDESFNSEAKSVIYVYAVLPDSTSYYTEYKDHLDVIKGAYRAVSDNFLYIDLTDIFQENGIVSNFKARSEGLGIPLYIHENSSRVLRSSQKSSDFIKNSSGVPLSTI